MISLHPMNTTNPLSFLKPELAAEILNISNIITIDKNTEVIRKDQYIKMLPIVLEGVVRVVSRFEERELLLYYIQSSQSCIMSFAASLKNQPSKVYAITEEKSKILLLPVSALSNLLKKHPQFNSLFYEQYDLRYSDLLETIAQMVNNHMDTRLYNYLKEKLKVTKQESLQLSHNQIANELGTVREVISRVLKKLEREEKIIQHKNGIRVL